MIIRLNSNRKWFPDTALADEDGLLAFGGDLETERLITAYSRGIFPWFSDETPILWYAPPERFVLFPDELHVSKSMEQVLRSGKFSIRINTAFARVIKACASAERPGQDGTWITDDMLYAYTKLHEAGYAHSVEVWKDDVLCGGLYGVKIGSVFCGESMFSLQPNASKAALIWLCRDAPDIDLVDCQIYSEHLERMGARLIPRDTFEKMLSLQTVAPSGL